MFDLAGAPTERLLRTEKVAQDSNIGVLSSRGCLHGNNMGITWGSHGNMRIFHIACKGSS
jgi:hypothetical protein